MRLRHQFSLGFDPNGYNVNHDITESGGLLVTGRIGTGKTTILQMLESSARARQYSVISNLTPSRITWSPRNVALLRAELEALRARIEFRHDLGTEGTRDAYIPVVIFIDDFKVLLSAAMNEQAYGEQEDATVSLSLLSTILRIGRGASVHIVLGSQPIFAQDLALFPALRDNAAALFLGDLTHGELASVCRDPYRVHDGMFRNDSSFQSCVYVPIGGAPVCVTPYQSLPPRKDR